MEMMGKYYLSSVRDKSQRDSQGIGANLDTKRPVKVGFPKIWEREFLATTDIWAASGVIPIARDLYPINIRHSMLQIPMSIPAIR